MAGARLTFDERKAVLKWYIKYENMNEVQRQWRNEFQTEPPDVHVDKTVDLPAVNVWWGYLIGIWLGRSSLTAQLPARYTERFLRHSFYLPSESCMWTKDLTFNEMVPHPTAIIVSGSIDEVLSSIHHIRQTQCLWTFTYGAWAARLVN